MTPLDFLNQLWQAKPDDHHILIWTFPDRRSRWFTDIAAAADYVGAVNGGRDVYVGVGLASKDHGPGHRCVSEEITGIAGMWSDLDLLSDAHSKKALPATIEQALTILPASMPPTIIVATGNGLHCWWLFKEPYIFDDDEDRKYAARIVARWHTLLRLNAAAQGWAYERLSDLARVLRILRRRTSKIPPIRSQSLSTPSPTADTTSPTSRSSLTMPRSPIRKPRRRPRASGPNGSRTSRC